jgi:phage terminase large subunit-like protein
MSSAIATSPRGKKAQSAPPPITIDPVTQYAINVRTGRVLAGRAVRLACARHERDLARQRTVAFPYYFDVAAAEHIINFYPTFLTLENGDPFQLPPWLQFCYGSLFGWKCWGGATPAERAALPAEHVKRAGARRHMHGFFETSKGSGKTPSAGGVALYGATFDEEPYAEIYTTGFDKHQGAIILNDAIRMAGASPDLLEMLIVDKYNIANPTTGSFIRAMSSEHRSKSGPRPHFILSDEIHEHRDGTVVTKAESGFKNRRQPLGLKYTNSGASKTSYCWQLHQKSLAVLEGSLVDEQWFAYICHLDPCPACFEEGYRQPKDGCADCDDWTDPSVWPKIAPALGIVIQNKYLQDAVDAALSMPSEYALKRRLNFCIWTETHQTWISPDKWKACEVASVSAANEAGAPAAMGLDPASTLDLAAGVVALRFDDPPELAAEAETVVIEGMDEQGAQIELAFTLNFHVELIPFFWMPRETQIDRVKNDRIPFDAWERDKKLFTTPGPAIDHQAIYDFIITDAWKRFRVQRLGMDENGGRYLFMQLRDQGRLGKQIVAVGQGKKLSEAFKFIEILIAHRRLRHDGNPVLTWCFANAEPHRDRLGALWIEKPEEKKRIDGAVATAMAIHQLMILPARRKKIAVFAV